MASAKISRPAGGRQLDVEAMAWNERAACREPGTDPELFFPIGEAGLEARQQVAAAKAVCARCPVTERCRDWAVRTGQSHGIWGGTTPEERRRLRRRRLHVA